MRRLRLVLWAVATLAACEKNPPATAPRATSAAVATPNGACVADGDRDICDGRDNDCNGKVDEGWTMQTDVVTGSSGPKGTRQTVNRWVGSTCFQPCAGSPMYSVRGKFECDVAKREMVCGSLESDCDPRATAYGADDPTGLVATYPTRN